MDAVLGWGLFVIVLNILSLAYFLRKVAKKRAGLQLHFEDLLLAAFSAVLVSLLVDAVIIGIGMSGISRRWTSGLDVHHYFLSAARFLIQALFMYWYLKKYNGVLSMIDKKVYRDVLGHTVMKSFVFITFILPFIGIVAFIAGLAMVAAVK